jgi:NitT/TauT family transport system ATP-binding protein
LHDTNVAGSSTKIAAAAPPPITLSGVDKIYANGTRALLPVDLTIRDGEFVSLIGPSGCGKSTVLKLAANLIEPTNGEVRWWGGGVEQIGTSGRHLSFVFQEPTLMPWARVAQNVCLPLDLADMPRERSMPRVLDALRLVGLDGFERHYPRQLSGGMMMRASIARALVTEPNVLLMDEPFGALDEFTRNRLDSDLISLWWKRKLTVAFVTHSIYEAVFLSTRVVVMSARPGRIHAQFDIDEPHPREDAFRKSPRFADLSRELTAILFDVAHAGQQAQ